MPFGAHASGEDFRQVDPDDCALRDGKGDDVQNQQRQQVVLVAGDLKNDRDQQKANGHADGADEQQRFAAELIDDRDGGDGCDQVGQPDIDGLLAGGEAVEAGSGERCRSCNK